MIAKLAVPRSQRGVVAKFLAATGIVDVTIKGALEVFYDTIELNGLVPKFDAIYPIIGGTAHTHKFNLLNPLDTNTAFRLTFNGGWVHDANGVTGNAINTFANTWYDDNTYAVDNDHHISIYSRTDNNLQQCDIGNFSGATTSTNIFARYLNLLFLRNQGVGTSSSTNTDSRGWFCSNRVGSTEIRGAKNATLTVQANTVISKIANRPYYIGALNQGLPAFTSSRQYAFVTIGKGLTDAELIIVYNAIQTFQTTIGRAV